MVKKENNMLKKDSDNGERENKKKESTILENDEVKIQEVAEKSKIEKDIGTKINLKTRETDERKE